MNHAGVSAILGVAFVLVSGAVSAPVHSQSETEQVRTGAKVYAQTCAMCHGDAGQGGALVKFPIAGAGHQLAKYKTALGLFEYNQMLMPFDDPGKINDEQKWAVTAWLLHRSGLLAPGVMLGRDNAKSIELRPAS